MTQSCSPYYPSCMKGRVGKTLDSHEFWCQVMGPLVSAMQCTRCKLHTTLPTQARLADILREKRITEASVFVGQTDMAIYALVPCASS